MLAVAAACERRATPASAPVAASPGAPAPVSTQAAAVTQGRELPGCAGRWWPLVDGAGWWWRLERAWVDGEGAPRWSTATRAAAVGAIAPVRAAAARFVVDAWPTPWTDALVTPLTVEVAGTSVRTVTPTAPRPAGDPTGAPAPPPAAAPVEPWLELGVDGPADGPERTVTAGAPGRPATLAFTWRTLADDLTITLACDLGPVAVEYHHHGTREELRAVRLGADQ